MSSIVAHGRLHISNNLHLLIASFERIMPCWWKVAAGLFVKLSTRLLVGLSFVVCAHTETFVNEVAAHVLEGYDKILTPEI